MSLKLKILGLGVLAVMATSAFAAMNASATTSGHFTHDAATTHATIVGAEEYHKPDSLSFQGTEPAGTKSGEPIVCTNATYHGLASAKTVQTLTITPTYSGCQTTGTQPHDTVKVTMNSCNYTFSSNANAGIDATVTVNCPPEKRIEIHHPNCTMTVGHQTLGGTATSGLTYTTTTGSTGKHTLTVDVTVKEIKAEYHGGICIFLGTNHLFDMTGAVKVEGLNTANEKVNITAT